MAFELIYRSGLLKLLPTAIFRNCCFDFSASGMVCQARMPGVLVASKQRLFLFFAYAFVDKRRGFAVDSAF